MIEVGSRLGFPALVDEQGQRKFKGYNDFIVNWQKSPGVGFLAGWRGADGDRHFVGEPNQSQWQAYIENDCFFEHHIPPDQRYYRFANCEYLAWAKEVGFTMDRARLRRVINNGW
jgi:hypothetical protein